MAIATAISVGLDQLHLHDLRHVAGTLPAAPGASTKEIRRRLGHATQDAALRYQGRSVTPNVGSGGHAKVTRRSRPRCDAFESASRDALR